MNYYIVVSDDEKTFEKKCSKELAAGATLVGGVSICLDADGVWFAQAFTKPVKMVSKSK